MVFLGIDYFKRKLWYDSISWMRRVKIQNWERQEHKEANMYASFVPGMMLRTVLILMQFCEISGLIALVVGETKSQKVYIHWPKSHSGTRI